MADNYVETKASKLKNGFCYVDLKDSPKSFRIFEGKGIRYKLDYAIEREKENFVMFFIRIPKKFRNNFFESMNELKNKCILCDSSYDDYCETFEEMITKASANI